MLQKENQNFKVHNQFENANGGMIKINGAKHLQNDNGSQLLLED